MLHTEKRGRAWYLKSCDQTGHVPQGVRYLESIASISQNVPCNIMLTSEIPFKSDDPSIAGIFFFEGKQIQGDIKRSPPMRANHPWTPLDLKRH